MKLNRDDLRALAKEDDQKLWETVKGIAKSYGYSLTDKTPSKEELKKLREILSGEVNFSMSDAKRLINQYKNGGK